MVRIGMQTDGKRQYEKRRQTAIDIKGLADRRTARDSKRRAERQQETVRGNQTDGPQCTIEESNFAQPALRFHLIVTAPFLL